MSAIFPPLDRGGVPPGSGVCNGYTPTHPTSGEGPLYVSPDCTTLLTDCMVNAWISEILAAVDELGFGFNAGSITNLGDALAAKFAEFRTLLDGKLNLSGGTMTGPLEVVCPPVNDNDASCKAYVDQAASDAAAACCDAVRGEIATIADGLQADINNRVRRDGDQMTGPLILSGDPTVPSGAATKNYVDNAVGGILVAPEPPTGIPDDRLWWDSTHGLLFLRYAGQWVQTAPGVSVQ